MTLTTPGPTHGVLPAEFDRYVDEYRRQLMHPYYAAERGLVHDVIDPVHTRRILIDAFETLECKKPELPIRKHGNLPI